MQRRLIAGREIGGVKSALRGSQRQTDAGEGDGQRQVGQREKPTAGVVGSSVCSTCADGDAPRARARGRGRGVFPERAGPREGELPPRWCSCGVEGASVRADGAAARALAGELPDDPDDGPEAHGGGRAGPAGELDRPAPGERLDTGSLQLDRALGGGWPRSSAVAVWGEPGAGKSRLAARWAARAGPWLLVATEAPAADA